MPRGNSHHPYLSDFNNNVLRLNNHPIKFTPLDFDPEKINHNIIQKGNKFYVMGQEGNVPLFGDDLETAIVECSTCHDPHGKSGLSYLQREDMSEEDFCITCHVNIRKSE